MTGVTEIEHVPEDDIKLEDPLTPSLEETGPVVAPIGPASGPDVVPRLLPGVRVVRGPDWKWGDQVSNTCTCTCNMIIMLK